MPKARVIPPRFKAPTKHTVRSYMSMDAQLTTARSGFDHIPDHRNRTGKITLSDGLMSVLAMFILKDPSLLAFDERRKADADNLEQIFGIKQAPCDTHMRELLDPVNPELLRPMFSSVFSQLQRGKALEPFAYYQGHYLISIDGTGSFSSKTLKSDSCSIKKHRDGTETYYQQVLGVAIVHPDFQEVIPLCPEMIQKQDGATKNDCERNAARRLLPKIREDHPRLKLIVIEDGLSSNGPHIKDLKEHNMRFILGAKPGDHPLLFHHVEKAIEQGTATVFSSNDPEVPEITHTFRFMNGVPLNIASHGLLLNFLGYEEHDARTNKTTHFSWVTDFTITRENAFTLMRGARARWKIENETFNTLKNQGYNLEHNYGLGKEHLSEVFVMLMMLAFLIDQTQQLTSALFRAAWQKVGSKRALWEQQRNLFHCFNVDSMALLYTAIVNGFRTRRPDIIYDDA